MADCESVVVPGGFDDGVVPVEGDKNGCHQSEKHPCDTKGSKGDSAGA